VATAGHFRSVSIHFSLRGVWSGPSELGPYKSTCGCACGGKDKPKKKRFQGRGFHRVHGEQRARPRSGADGVVEVMVEVELDVAEGGVGIFEAAQE